MWGTFIAGISDFRSHLAQDRPARRSRQIRSLPHGRRSIYVLVYPEAKKAKVWRLVEGEYRKVADFRDEIHRFELSKCAFDFDFGHLWKRKGGGHLAV